MTKDEDVRMNDEEREERVAWAEKLGDQITDWATAWDAAAAAGLADSPHCMEWRHSLMRFLAMDDQRREAWSERHWAWRIRNVHHDVDEGSGTTIFQQDQPDWVPERERAATHRGRHHHR
jgi:hypothetical protein